jgi:hypothetical protein
MDEQSLVIVVEIIASCVVVAVLPCACEVECMGMEGSHCIFPSALVVSFPSALVVSSRHIERKSTTIIHQKLYSFNNDHLSSRISNRSTRTDPYHLSSQVREMDLYTS